MKPILLSLLAGCVGLLLLPAAVEAQLEDQVYGAGGAPTRGTITGMSPTEVSLDTSGGARKIPVNQIRYIRYADEDGELRSARDKAARGQLEDALKDLSQIDVAKINRDVVKQDVEFYKAFCAGRLALAGTGDKAAAVRAMLAWAKAYPGNYHFFESAELLGDLAIALGSYDNAALYYGSLARAPWPDYQMKSSVLEAQALVAQKKYAEAQTKYEAVIAMDLGGTAANTQKALAQVGRVVCMSETGKHEEGVAVLNKIIAETDLAQPDNAKLAARLYNALGGCHRKADRTKEAILAYLHVDLLYRRDPDSHAESLFYLSQLWAAINKSERAVAARTLLRDAYSGSSWAK